MNGLVVFALALLPYTQVGLNFVTREESEALAAAAAADAVAAIPRSGGTMLEHSPGCATNINLSGNPATLHYWQTADTNPEAFPNEMDFAFDEVGPYLRVLRAGIYAVSFSVQYTASTAIDFETAVVVTGGVPAVDITPVRAQLTGSIGNTRTGASAAVTLELRVNERVRLAFFGPNFGTLNLCDVSVSAFYAWQIPPVPPG